MGLLMPPESADSSPGAKFWYGSSLPSALPSLPADAIQPRIQRRHSHTVLTPNATFQSQEPLHWPPIAAPFHADTPVALGAESATASVNPKAPLAPKQGVAGGPTNARSQHQSPIAGTYALRTPRGKITSIACESCRKRKSKCDGVRPKCNTCQTKNLPCNYDVMEDGKTTTQLRAHVRRLMKDFEDMKSIVSLLAMASDRTSAARWATELEKNGFAHHSAEEVKRALQGAGDPASLLPGQEGLEACGSEPSRQLSQSVVGSSYDEKSSRDQSREQSQPATSFVTPDHVIKGPESFAYTEIEERSKLMSDCAFYLNANRGMFANGWQQAQMFGRQEIDVEAAVCGYTDQGVGQSVDRWAARTINIMLPSTALPERLAYTFFLTKMMRWLIWPSVETSNAMPDWLRPLGGQKPLENDLLIDLLPWPQVRQYFYQNPDEFFPDAFVGLVETNWPYGDQACHYIDEETSCWLLSPGFVAHINNLHNWVLDAKAVDLVPQVEFLVPLKR